MESSLEDLKRVSSNELDLHSITSVTTGPNGVPYLTIIRQDNVSTEHLSKNGFQKPTVHIVVKNLNFPVELASSVDLKTCFSFGGETSL